VESRDHKKSVEHNFDSFCKKVLKNRAVDIQRELKRRVERESSFSGLSARQLLSLAATDDYFKGEYFFDVLGESVGVLDGELAEALAALPEDRMQIVLMSYFFDLSDREIAERLNMARRTVAHRRAVALQELKDFLESGG